MATSRPLGTSQGSPAYLGWVYDGGLYVAGTGVYYLTHPAQLIGVEAEGNVPTIEVDSDRSILVLQVGSKIPALGDLVLARLVDGHWVTRSGRSAEGTCNPCVFVQTQCLEPPLFLPVRIDTATVTLKLDGVTIQVATMESHLSGIVRTAPGSGFDPANPPMTIVSGGGGSGAVVRAVLGGGSINSTTVTAGGSGYKRPQVQYLGGRGHGAVGIPHCHVDSLEIRDGGSGYTDGSYTDGELPDPDGLASDGTFDYVVAGGKVTSATITDGGSNFLIAPIPIIHAPGGSGAILRARLAIDTITGGGGSLYFAPTVNIYDGGGGHGSGATATATATTVIVNNYVIDDPGSGYTTAPSVATNGPPGSGGTGTGVIAIRACFEDVAPDDYELLIEAPGYLSETLSITYPPCTATTVVDLADETAELRVHVDGCSNLPLAGASVVAKQGGSTVASGTTDASGDCTLAIPAGVATTVEITASRFDDFSDSIPAAYCLAEDVNAVLDVASGYACNCQPPVGGDPDRIAIPLATTLTLSELTFGDFTLTYDPGDFLWKGSRSVSFGGSVECPAQTVLVSWEFDGCSLHLEWSGYNYDPPGPDFFHCPGPTDGTPFDFSNPGVSVSSPPPAYLATATVGFNRLFPSGTSVSITE